MREKTRILFLSANPWTTSRIRVDEEAREVFERIQEGPCRNQFELHKHAALRPMDIQRLLMTYEPHIVHFSVHASKTQKIILSGTPGRGREVDRKGLAELFALYKDHVRFVFLNACFTRIQARFLSEVIDYSIGTSKVISDKAGVAFAGAFYRAIGFGKSIKVAFESAKAELGLTKLRRTQGIELFVRKGLPESDTFPRCDFIADGEETDGMSVLPDQNSGDREVCRYGVREEFVVEHTEERAEHNRTVIEKSVVTRYSARVWSEVQHYAAESKRKKVPKLSRKHPARVRSQLLPGESRGKSNRLVS